MSARYYKYKWCPDYYIYRDMCSRTGYTICFYVFKTGVHNEPPVFKSHSLDECKSFLRSCVS